MWLSEFGAAAARRIEEDRLLPGLRFRRPTVLAASFALVATLGVSAGTSPAVAADPVAFWLTDANNPGGSRMEYKGTVNWGSSTAAGAEITVEPSHTFQSVVGFGASITDSTSYNINHQLTESERDRWFQDLFSRSTSSSEGIGLSWLRQPLGASDYIRTEGRPLIPVNGNSPFYTYQDVEAGGVSIDADNPAVADARRALQINPDITVVGSPWSPPGWMRQNNTVFGWGGPLRTDRELSYANYLREVSQQYRDAGVPLRYLTLQNEPRYEPGYPGMWMPPEQQVRVANLLAPQLRNAGLSTEILAWDHNWDEPGYPEHVLQYAGDSVAGTAWHCYGVNDPSVPWQYDPSKPAVTAASQTQVRDQFPDKDVFFTECSGTVGSNEHETFSGTVGWHMRLYAIPVMRNWSRSLSFWNLALDQNNGPYPGGYGICDHCSGITTVNTNTKTYSRSAGYYVLGHFSKFVVPGAVRIGSSEISNGVSNVAFRNPDGSYALVVHNGGGQQTIGVTVGGQRFTQSLQENAIATFTWGGGGEPDPDQQPDPVVDESDGPIGAIVNPSSSKCLDLASGSSTKANGTPIQLWECNGTIAQRWQQRIADQSIRVRGKCLTTATDSNGAVAELWDCGTQRVKAWTVTNGKIMSPGGRCLAVPGNSSSDGVQLQLAACGASGQQWLVPDPAAEGRTTISSIKAPNRCVGISGAAVVGAEVRSVACTSSARLQMAADSSLRFGDKCVAYRAAGATTAAANGSRLLLAYCTGESAQRWQRVGNELRLDGTSFSLDLTDGDTIGPVQLQVWTFDPAGNQNQQWMVMTEPDGGPDDGDPGDGGDGPGDGGDGPGGNDGPGNGADNGGSNGSQPDGGNAPDTGKQPDDSGLIRTGKAKSRIAKVKIVRGKTAKRSIRVKRKARIRVVVRTTPQTKAKGVVRFRVGKRVIGKAKLRVKGKKSVAVIRIGAKKNRKLGRIRVVYRGSKVATKATLKSRIFVRKVR
ncbi:O-Glycosyl hydrolase [Micrococcales bacterium KH10]|nr:O-Glycosyl hydrolase [Micrococcales bacterium KH10]